ncbi:putative cysteine-rich receptor-like protein kinase 31, partial [Mucuna pruriens]
MDKNVSYYLEEAIGHESVALEPLQFNLAVIEAATNNFSNENRIGKGGFGEVYKGILLDGRQIAVKKLSKNSKQGANDGYMSPEYAMLGQFSEKSDVFSFGVMILEIITGKKNLSSYEPHLGGNGLLNYVWRQWRDQTPLNILDPSIKEEHSKSEVTRCIQIGLLSIQQNPNARPTMIEIVSYLSSYLIELPSPQEPTLFLHGIMGPKTYAQESSSSQSNIGSTPFSINEMSISEFLPR